MLASAGEAKRLLWLCTDFVTSAVKDSLKFHEASDDKMNLSVLSVFASCTWFTYCTHCFQCRQNILYSLSYKVVMCFIGSLFPFLTPLLDFQMPYVTWSACSYQESFSHFLNPGLDAFILVKHIFNWYSA